MVERIALITALIVDRPVCLTCLTTRAEMSMEETTAIIELIGDALTVHRAVSRCRVCGDTGAVVFADQPI